MSDVIEEVIEETPNEVVDQSLQEESSTEEIEASSNDESSEVVEVQAETEAELEEEIKDAIEEGASDEVVKDMIRKFTLKVDGKEFIKEVDLNNEEELTRQFQLAAKGQKSMQELQELKNLYSQQLDRLIQDPFKVLKEMNPEFDAFDVSAKYIDQLAKEQELSPEERAEVQRQTEFEEIKAERDKLKQDAEDKVAEAERQQLADEIQTDIMSALDSDNDLVADRETVALVAENLMWAVKNNMTDITAKDVLPTVKEQLRANFQRAASRFKSVDSLKSHMGDDILAKLKEERVAQAKQQIKNATSVNKGVSKSTNSNRESKKINLSTLFR